MATPGARHATPGSFQKKRPFGQTDTPHGLGGSSSGPSSAARTSGKDDEHGGGSGGGASGGEKATILMKPKRSRGFKETNLVSGKGLYAILTDFPKLPFKGHGHEVEGRGGAVMS